MKKASEILLLIGFILGIISAVGTLVTSIVFFVLGSPAFTDILIEGLKDGSTKTDFPGTPEEQAALIQGIFSTVGACCIFGMLVEVAAVIVAFFARQRQKQGLYIATIVLGALCGGVCLVVGSIFGLVAVNRNPAPLEAQE